MENKAKFEYYINVVGRESDLFRIDGDDYKEIIAPGAYEDSLRRYGYVPVLFNHDHSEVIANKDDVELYEDQIGLVAIFKTDNVELINKIINEEISGCSFGFIKESYKDVRKKGYIQRTITKMKLLEVSLLDKSRKPVYVASALLHKKIPCELEHRAYESRILKLDYDVYEARINALKNRKAYEIR